MKLKTLLATTAITALSAAAAQAQDVPRVGAAVYGLNAEFMQIWSAALEEHPAVTEGVVEITIFDGRYDALVQNDQFDTMIVGEFDGIIFVPIDIEAGATAVQAAHEAGIPVVGSNTRVNSDLLLSYVGSNDVVSGGMEAQAVIDCIGGSGSVVILEGPIGQSAQIERRRGNLDTLDANPDVEMLEMEPANWSRAEALALMENWLTAYGDDIDGIIGQNDEMALGAIEAIRAAGLDPHDFCIAGIDGVTDALLAVQEGTMVSILQDARAQAQGALDVVLREIIGPDYQPMSDIWELYPDMPWNDGQDALYNVPWTPVTDDNVEDLLAQRQ